MDKPIKALSAQGKEDLALTLILWKDFKSQGHGEVIRYGVTMRAIELALHLDVSPEFERMLSLIPLMRIEPRRKE